MICRLTGRIAAIHENTAIIDTGGTAGGVSYEVLVPASSLPDLRRLTGNDVLLHTIQYMDGNPSMGHMMPRMLGFLNESDRDFFYEFIKVKNVGMKKALRAMCVPVHQLAAAIESGDERTLSGLPEIGKRTAAQIIAQLHGRLARFLTAAAAPMPVTELNEAQRLALEMLITWGDRPADAHRWLTRALDLDPGLKGPDELVRAAYRIKQGVSS